MLIQRNGGYCGSAPVKLSLHSKETGFVMIGDESLRILLDSKEIRELHRLLDLFIRDADGRATRSTGLLE